MELEKRLNELRCLQTWGFSDYPPIDDFGVRSKDDNEKEDPKKEEEEYTKTDPHLSLMKSVSWSFEYYRIEDFNLALEYAEEAAGTTYSDFMIKYKKVFDHVVLATRAFCLFKLGRCDEVLMILDELDFNKHSLSTEEEAGFMYVESRCAIKHGRPASTRCKNLMTRAVDLMPDEATFHHFLGCIYTRIRHFTYPPDAPSNKEHNHLRTAVRLEKTKPRYAISLARYFVDLSKSKRSMKKNILAQATSLFREALKYHDDLSGGNIARCVFEIIKVEFDPALEESADEALTKSPNSIMVNHYVGMFYVTNNQYDKALECFEVASKILPFVIGLPLLLKYRLDGNQIDQNTIDQTIEQALERLKGNPKGLYDLHIRFCEFFLLVLNDTKKASEHFDKALDIDPDMSKWNPLSLSKTCRAVSVNSVMLDHLVQDYHGDDKQVLDIKKRALNLSSTSVSWNPKHVPYSSIVSSLY